jgi:photosystem II stability/assembly factor-like uncharacterized protein
VKQFCALVGIAVVLTGCAAIGKGPGLVGTPTMANPPASASPPATWNVKQAHLVSPATGWVLATSGTNQGTPSLLTTTDGGHTWADATPPALTEATKTTEPAVSPTVHFADDKNGWLAFFATRDGASEMVVAHTVDGGRSWSRSVFPMLNWERIPWLASVDPRTGWLLATSSPALGMMFKSVFQTQDAGAHWQLLSRGGGPGGTETPENLPNTEYITGITFRSATEGWVTARYRYTTDVALYHTADAGRTWQRLPIAYPDTGSRISYCDAFPPQFFGADRTAGMLVLQCRGTPEPGWVAVYVTVDGGRTWTSRSALPGMIEDRGSYDFITADHGWALLDSGDLQMTGDGGRTWTQVANLPAKYGKIDFADQQTGWLTDTSGSLQATADGGRTWTSLSVGTR